MARLLKDTKSSANDVVTLMREGDRHGIVCERCVVADSPLTRMKGLLGKEGLTAGEGILLRPSSSIHTAFMGFPIDALFLDAELRVVGVRSQLRPWRVASCRRAKSVVELAAGEAERRGIEVGDRLKLSAADDRVHGDSLHELTGDTSSLVERIGAVIAREGREPTWKEVEGLLTEGYAHTLALESDRWQIERRLATVASSSNGKAGVELRALMDRHTKVDREIQWLRCLLAELLEYGVGLRDAARVRAA